MNDYSLKIYHQGALAYRLDTPSTDNPYKKKDKYCPVKAELWQQGYRETKEFWEADEIISTIGVRK